MSFDGELLVIKTLQATTVDEFVTVFGVLPIEPHPIPKRFAVVLTWVTLDFPSKW